jgi:hypothetical protein
MISNAKKVARIMLALARVSRLRKSSRIKAQAYRLNANCCRESGRQGSEHAALAGKMPYAAHALRIVCSLSHRLN